MLSSCANSTMSCTQDIKTCGRPCRLPRTQRAELTAQSFALSGCVLPTHPRFDWLDTAFDLSAGLHLDPWRFTAHRWHCSLLRRSLIQATGVLRKHPVRLCHFAQFRTRTARMIAQHSLPRLETLVDPRNGRCAE